MKKQIPFIANSVHTAEVYDNVQGCQDFEDVSFEDISTLIIIINYFLQNSFALFSYSVLSSVGIFK